MHTSATNSYSQTVWPRQKSCDHNVPCFCPTWSPCYLLLESAVMRSTRHNCIGHDSCSLNVQRLALKFLLLLYQWFCSEANNMHKLWTRLYMDWIHFTRKQTLFASITSTLTVHNLAFTSCNYWLFMCCLSIVWGGMHFTKFFLNTTNWLLIRGMIHSDSYTTWQIDHHSNNYWGETILPSHFWHFNLLLPLKELARRKIFVRRKEILYDDGLVGERTFAQ